MSEFPLLDSIASPDDVKQMDASNLTGLAAELRNRIITVMAKKGGHLGSNLGTVELALALHRVFSSPHDQFVWDVSHQAYAHKLLTGRHKQFETIRQTRGVCGFTHPDESPHDHFHVGHAGTALAQGLGLAKSRDLAGKETHVVSVIGDATLNCGMTLEAFNNIPEHLKRYIVVLNDNQMSISANVGALKNMLSRLLSNPTSNRIYQGLESLTNLIPGVGSSLARQGKKLTESVKNMVSSAPFFEEFGLWYTGPFDGHDLHQLIAVFEALKDVQQPVLVHILTQKGKGLEEAIKDPVSYHGAKPFCLQSGKFHTQTASGPTFPKVFGEAMLQMARSDEEVVVVTPAMLAGSCLTALHKEIPERCLDVGIAESHAVTFAGSLLYKSNLKVMLSIYATFLQRGLDNLFQDVCLQGLPLVLALDRSGLSAADGATHHGIFDISFLSAMPGMVIAQPRNGTVLTELLHSAFAWKRPTAIRYPNMETTCEPSSRKRILGEAEVLVQGSQILLITLGHMAKIGHELIALLHERGIAATLLDPVFVKPLDTDMLCQLLPTHTAIVTIEEHAVHGGLATVLSQWLATSSFRDRKVLNFGVPDRFVEHGAYKDLMQAIGLTTAQIWHKMQATLPELAVEPADAYCTIS